MSQSREIKHPLSSSRGSVLGAALLVAGTSIGAGMLALPIKAGVAGFFPFSIFFLFAWLFMTGTGLLLLEANLFCGEGASIVTIAGKTLGRWGKILSWITFCFLFYSLMVAYVAASSTLVISALQDFASLSLPYPAAAFIVSLLFGLLIYLGVAAVDHVNRFLMLGLLASYFLLVIIGLPHVQRELLLHEQWGIVPFALPVMVIMFGFHNIVPSLTQYLRADGGRLKRSIFYGSLLAFIVCFAWGFLILGIVPAETIAASQEGGSLATQALQKTVGFGWIGSLAESFSFFAIVTSCLGVALSLVDFLSDGLRIPKTPPGLALLCTLVMLPPFFLALTSPGIFFKALDYAGGFATVILFGIIPALMAWVIRYKKKQTQNIFVPGGRAILGGFIFASIAIFFLELIQELNIL